MLEQPAVEKLREYLRDLKPAARALLMGELERTLLRGDDLGGAEVILAELRREIRDGVSDAERVGAEQLVRQDLVDVGGDRAGRIEGLAQAHKALLVHQAVMQL